MRLDTLERAFAAHVMDGEPAITTAVAATPDYPAGARLAVYVHAYRSRLAGVLREDFPATLAALGPDAEAVMDAYIRAHPSRSFTLRDFGAAFPAFLQAENLGWQAELAQFEWAFCEAFDAPDAPVVTIADMARVAPEQWPRMGFVLQPALRRLDSRYNLPALWRAARNGEALTAPEAAGPVLPVLIWRQDYATRYRSLEADEALALDAVLAGGGFAEACAALSGCMAPPDAPARAASLLKTWLDQTLVAALAFEPA